jgi:hypothetical protein
MKTSKVWTGLIATAALFLASAICAQEPNTAASAPQATAPYSAEAKQGPSPAPRLSRGITDLLKMQERGIDKSVMRSYIESSPVAYQPTVEEIIYLHQQGLPDDLTTLLIHHGAQLRAQSPVPAQNQASIGADSTPVAAPVQPQQPIVVSTPAPVYNVPSTTYVYSDPYPVYGPSVSLDFGFWGSPYWRSYPYYRSYGFHGGSYVSHGWSGGYHGGSDHGGYSGHSYGGGGHFGGGSHSGGGGGHHR